MIRWLTWLFMTTGGLELATQSVADLSLLLALSFQPLREPLCFGRVLVLVLESCLLACTWYYCSISPPVIC